MFSADAHENVIPSLMAAPPWADGVYINVRLTSDGEAVLMHDATVQRTTNGVGAVADLTLAQIQALDAGGGATVPTLAEYLQAVIDLEAAQPNRRPLSQIFINVADESLASVTEAYTVATDNTFSALHDRYVWIWGLGSSTTGATNLRLLDATARIGTWHSIGSASDATTIMGLAASVDADTILAFPGGYAAFPDAVDLLTAGGYQSGLSRTENMLT